MQYKSRVLYKINLTCYTIWNSIITAYELTIENECDLLITIFDSGLLVLQIAIRSKIIGIKCLQWMTRTLKQL